ncbi:MAG: hypothetical protein GWP36_01830, partial [Bacteroidetes bacterium]|nr:hypothetical protein [Bacteroidota bacterium]
DLSESEVKITSSYHGTELLLFGAFEGENGDDVVLLVSGPNIRLAQRRSDKVAGIWVNVETKVWENAPSFYHVFSTRPLTEITDSTGLADAMIGASALPLSFTPYEGGAISDPNSSGHDNAGNGDDVSKPSAQMIEGLVRNMKDLGLWAESNSGVTVQRNTLFRATLTLPKNVPTGDYEVRVVHFRDGTILSEETTAMIVKRAGFSAAIYNFAHEHSALYGIFAIIFAVCSGWLAAVAFRRK